MRRTLSSYWMALAFLCSAFLGTLTQGSEPTPEPPVRAEHLGWVLDKTVKTHVFNLTFVNRENQPVWIVLPLIADEPLSKDGPFRNHDDGLLPEELFAPHWYEGKGGSVVDVHFVGREAFSAVRLPAKGKAKVRGWSLSAPGAFAFDKIAVLEARDLMVNGKVPLETWLPFEVTSGRDVTAAREKTFDEPGERGIGNDIGVRFPRGNVEFIKPRRSKEWVVRFRARGRMDP